MFICAIHKSLVDVRKDEDDFALLLVRNGVVVSNFLVELQEKINNSLLFMMVTDLPES